MSFGLNLSIASSDPCDASSKSSFPFITSRRRRPEFLPSWYFGRWPLFTRVAQISRTASLPPIAALGEDGLEVAFEEGAGVLEVLFGVGFGGGDALKRFVEDADDPLLFGERRERDG